MKDLNNRYLPLFSYLSKEEIESLRPRLKIKNFKKSEPIFSFGSKPDFMYVIIEGYVKISMFLSDGREQVLYTYGKNDFVGAHNILTGENYIYEATALTKARVLLISREDFEGVLKKNKDILLKILDQSFKRIRRSEELIDRLVGLNADIRVAKLLIDLSNDIGKKTKEGILIKLHLNREELGSYSGVVRETLSRKLSYFADLGLIEFLSRSEILVKDLDSLEKICS